MYVIGIDTHILQIQTYCSKVNLTPDTTLHITINYFPWVSFQTEDMQTIHLKYDI